MRSYTEPPYRGVSWLVTVTKDRSPNHRIPRDAGKPTGRPTMRWADRAQKKPPERLRPRGAKDTVFSGGDWMLRGCMPPLRWAVELPHPLSTRSVPLRPPCPRYHASWSAGTSAGARPQMQTRNDGSLAAPRSHPSLGSVTFASRGGENMEFAVSRQGRFSLLSTNRP